MSTASVAHALVGGFDALVMENDLVRVVVLPSLGGRVWELTDRVRNRQWIWHRADVPLQAAAPGSSYDDLWAGGWEELFPNDAPGEFEGRVLPDHGSWWTTAWNVESISGGSEAVVRLTAGTADPRTSAVKEFRLAAGSASLHARYRITSREAAPFHFLFKQHLPVAVTAACRLALPGGRVTAVDPSFGTLLKDSPTDWPAQLEQVRDQSSESREFVYVSDLPDGWCGVDDPAAGAALRMHVDLRQMPFTWLFLTYGGWRGCNTAVLEPCTNMPKDLAAALRAGHCARLAPGGVFETAASVTVAALTTTSRA